jgi:acyl carrier protein
MLEFETKVISIVSQQLGLGPGEVTKEKYLKKDLEADSMDMVSLLVAVEEEFKIEIKDSDAANIKSVQDVVNCVQSILNQKL